VKAFRGTLIAAAILLVVGLIVWIFDIGRPPPEQTVVENQPLFRFEKQEMTRVEIVRPTDTLVLSEKEDGEWLVEGPGWEANKSMVNRVKHQIHDLDARASVVENPKASELYGLGKNAVQVHLTLRDGRKIDFLAGDPNPSNVSYYVQPVPGDKIYTVKKSSMDYYAMKPEEFRERKFASLDSNDADKLDATLPGGKVLSFQRVDADNWVMKAPLQYRADRESVRRLLGRVTALKARDFVEDHPADLAKYGLDRPKAEIRVEFASREPIDLLIGGAAAPDEGPGEVRTYAYMMMKSGFTVYTARDDLLEDFVADPHDMRLKRFMRMKVGDVTDAVVNLSAHGDEDLEGQVTFLYRADKWLWEDGTPVPGSTPSRVANRAAEVEADTIVADNVSDAAKWGFDKPILTIQLTDRTGASRTLLIGKEAEPDMDPEGRERPRYFARADDEPLVYRVDGGVVDVAEDAVREYRRKDTRDEDKADRQKRMGDAMGEVPEPQVLPEPLRRARDKKSEPPKP